MRFPGFQGLRGRLSYANVIATLALFFALTGSAAAGVKYLQASDPITQGDLAGSTYGHPVLAAGAVDSAKIANGAVTNSKLATNARLWAVVQSGAGNTEVMSASKSGVTVNHVEGTGSYLVDFGTGTPQLGSCAAVASSRLAVSASAFPAGTQVGVHVFDVDGNAVDTDFSVAVFC
jgi:hypothetical protein